MTLIETITVGSGGASSIEFTGIPGTGKDLLILVSSRNSSTSVSLEYRLNSDSTSSAYVMKLLQYKNGLVDTDSITSTKFSGVGVSTNYTANTFTSNAIYVSNYAGSTNKSVSIDEVSENNATQAYLRISAGVWNNTAAVTAFSVTSPNLLVEHSSASLYTIS